MEELNLRREKSRQLTRSELIFNRLLYVIKVPNSPPTRAIHLFLASTFYALSIYFLSIHQINTLPTRLRWMLFSFLLVVVTASMNLMQSSRCTLTLVVFNFLTSGGKILITSAILDSIVEGPVGNTAINVAQFGASVRCQYSVMKNLSKVMSETNMNVNRKIMHDIRQFSNFINFKS